jgi:hypothetical protein
MGKHSRRPPAFNPKDLLPTYQTLACLHYMRERYEKRMGLGINPRHFDIICMRVGLLGYKRHRFREIADQYGVTNTRIHQIYQRALFNVRRHCERCKVDPVAMHIIHGTSYYLEQEN